MTAQADPESGRAPAWLIEGTRMALDGIPGEWSVHQYRDELGNPGALFTTTLYGAFGLPLEMLDRLADPVAAQVKMLEGELRATMGDLVTFLREMADALEARR